MFNRFVELNNDMMKTEYVHDEMSLVDLIRDKMGDDVADNVRDIVVESDLRSYELSLESKDSALNEILDGVNGVINYMLDAKRINRDRIDKELRIIKDKILNEI